MKIFPLKYTILSLSSLCLVACSSVKTATVGGTISAIESGKDGYTATIESEKGTVYYGTISIPNASNTQLFQQPALGDTIMVKGALWKMGKEKRITVKEIVELRKKDRAEAKITGIVQSIEKGKDGYTAKIKTAERKIYFATVSIPNLGSASQYRLFTIGAPVTLFGEIWKMGQDNRLTVRKIIE